MKDLILFVLRNDLYQMIYYTIDGEDLSENDYKNLLNKDFEIIHQQKVNDFHKMSGGDKELILFNLTTNNDPGVMIELYIDEAEYKSILREYKINQILCVN